MEQIKLEVGKTYLRRNRRMKLTKSLEKIVCKSHGHYVGESGMCYDLYGQHNVSKSGYDLIREVPESN
jgi:hypothetical protein